MFCKEYIGINCETAEVADIGEENILAEYLYDIKLSQF